MVSRGSESPFELVESLPLPMAGHQSPLTFHLSPITFFPSLPADVLSPVE
jgi:hypothetical protein